MTLDKTSLLKIDKDCFVDKSWIEGYVRAAIQICSNYGLTVVHMKMCRSRRKGLHFYITVTPTVDADQENYLQWLLGDDCQRVDFNRARIESGLTEWNKLFEAPETLLMTIYSAAELLRKRRLNKAVVCFMERNRSYVQAL